jgi:hypothetical protein
MGDTFLKMQMRDANIKYEMKKSKTGEARLPVQLISITETAGFASLAQVLPDVA